MATEHQFIFLAGLHRSGTTLLHEILKTHPDISGFQNTGVSADEGQHLQSVYPPAIELGGPGKFGFDQAAHMDENHPLATPENAQKLFQEWSPYWNLDCPNLVEKSPPNLLRMRFLQKLFPKAAFVVLLRHPVAVAYATQKWSGTSIRSLIAHTLLCYERAMHDLAHLKRAYVVRYADLVGNPRREVNALLAWLGLPPMEIRQKIQSDLNQAYFARWHRDRKNILWNLWSGIGRDIEDFEDRSRRFGYSLYERAAVLPAPGFGPQQATHRQDTKRSAKS